MPNVLYSHKTLNLNNCSETKLKKLFLNANSTLNQLSSLFGVKFNLINRKYLNLKKKHNRLTLGELSQTTGERLALSVASHSLVRLALA